MNIHLKSKNRSGCRKNELRASKSIQCDALNRIIGQRLAKARAALGLRAADICAAFPLLNKSHLSVWESGQKQIPTYWLRELSRHYGVSLDYIVGDINDCEEVRSSFFIRRTIVDASEKYINQLAFEMEVVANKQSVLIEAQNITIEIGKDICTALNRVKKLDPEGWEDLRGGAPVEAAVQRFEQSLIPVANIKNQMKAIKDLQVEESYQAQRSKLTTQELDFEEMFSDKTD